MDTIQRDRAAVAPRFPFWLLPLLASWGYGTWLYFQLPQSVPAHWNMEGRIDRYGAPWEAAFLLPLVMVLEASLFFFLWRKNRRLGLMFATILTFMFCIHLLVGSSSATGHLPAMLFGASPVIGLVPLLLSWLFGAWVYGRLPERVPIHWGLHGEVDGWGNRFVGAFLLPIMLTVISGVMLALSREAPVILITGFLFALQVVMSRIQLGYKEAA
jgi:uncharacterized membrane protein